MSLDNTNIRLFKTLKALPFVFLYLIYFSFQVSILFFKIRIFRLKLLYSKFRFRKLSAENRKLISEQRDLLLLYNRRTMLDHKFTEEIR